MSHGGSHAPHAGEQHGLTPRQYIGLGLALTVITIVELGASLWVDLGDLLIPVLIVLVRRQVHRGRRLLHAPLL